MKLKITASLLLTLCVAAMYAQPIVGGSTSQKNEFPWMVQLVAADGEHICGGSLIRSNWVLSAGHCGLGFENIVPKPSRVIINGLSSANPQAGSQTINIDTIIVFPGYDLMGDMNSGIDISLMRLSSHSTYTPCLTATANDAALINEGQPVTAMGWGILNDDDFSTPDTLQKASIKMISQTTCQSTYGFNHLGYLCAGYTSPDKQAGAASGDSGGPLVAKRNGEWVQVGIVSGGSGLVTTEEGPGRYVSVIALSKWIDSTIHAQSAASAVQDIFNPSPIKVIAVQGTLAFETPAAYDKLTVQLHDISGRLLVEKQLTNLDEGRYEIETGTLAEGIKLLTFINPTGNYVLQHTKVVF